MKATTTHVLLLALVACMPKQGVAEEDLALGKMVRFAPAPNYRLTAKGDSDATDLTDGKLTKRKDDKLWFDSSCVGWSYPGLAQLTLDLGQVEPVGEVAIRLQGGSPQAGIAYPGWVDLAVSVDGTTYYKVASYSKWNPGDKAKFGVPKHAGKAWVHKLAFKDVNVRARYVGLSFYGSGLNIADELYVLRGPAGTARDPKEVGEAIAMATDGIAMYFHKPSLMVSTNIATPNPVGVIVGKGFEKTAFEVVMDLPEGLTLRAGGFGNAQVGEPSKSKVAGATRVTFKVKAMASNKAAGRLFFACDWEPGRRGEIRYTTKWAGGSMPACSIPIEAIEIPQCPVKSKRLMLGLGWWGLGASMAWPNCLDAFETIGFNTVPLMAHWTKFDEPEVKAFLADVGKRGFRVVNVDSPFHRMLSRHKKDKEMYCQFADGSVGKRMCPSYRGKHFGAEIQRVAAETARAGASYLTCDIELWGWRGPTDAAKCTRCQADFKASGKKDLEAWQRDKGFEIWRTLSEAVRSEMAKTGLPAPDMGGYDFEAGKSYQFFWPFDRLYPKYMQSSQVSTYTPLEPYHIELIGRSVREQRALLPKSDVLPWLTPGDAGTFPGDALRYALLECFCNGARGVYFWSGRVWDTESLAAFARTIRNIAPAEDVIVDGKLLEGAMAMPNARVSGMRKGDRMVVLVADYGLVKPKTVQLRLPVQTASVVTDLDTGERLGAVSKDRPIVRVLLGLEKARVLLVEPAGK